MIVDTRKTLCVDFDNCIHNMSEGWQEGRLYGDVVTGFFDWFRRTHKDFRIVIFSTRCIDVEHLNKMSEWLVEKYDQWAKENGLENEVRPTVEFTDKKIPAIAYIDDRAIRFTGNWEDYDLTVDALKEFRPWNEA